MCRGLAESLPANVDLYEESPVLRVEPGSPVQIECAEGSISAANVLLTTNAFIAKLNFLRRKVFPLIACASLSRPLTEAEQAAMSGAPDWGITGWTSVRRTLSNRILYRHGTYYTGDFRLNQAMRRQLIAKHAKGLRRRFPMLDNLDFQYTWAGVFCMSRNWKSIFGRLDRGVFASLGYAGIGLPMGTISGKLLADFALGDESTLTRDVQALSGPKGLPPEPFLGLGVRARMWWESWRNQGEW
jgi:glycine/D-amino acid oxidase-like deaminating enzyme